MRRKISADEIDAVLPQTQCGLCGYGGCMPYAVAITNQEAEIDLCTPGGVKVLQKIGDILGRNADEFVPGMAEKHKPRQVAVIREAECIGCTKCIQACPVDAIIGASKVMHSVISSECSGCELCIPPCPVDCIDMIDVDDEVITKEMSDQYRDRYHARNVRIKKEKNNSDVYVKKDESVKKLYVFEAIQRAKINKIK